MISRLNSSACAVPLPLVPRDPVAWPPIRRRR